MGSALIIKNYYYLGFLNLLRKREERTLLLSRVKFLQHDSSSTSSVLRLPFCFYFKNFLLPFPPFHSGHPSSHKTGAAAAITLFFGAKTVEQRSQ